MNTVYLLTNIYNWNKDTANFFNSSAKFGTNYVTRWIEAGMASVCVTYMACRDSRQDKIQQNNDIY